MSVNPQFSNRDSGVGRGRETGPRWRALRWRQSAGNMKRREAGRMGSLPRVMERLSKVWGSGPRLKACEHRPKCSATATQKRSLHRNESEEPMASDSEILKWQFEAFAHYARQEARTPEPASCFDALAASVDEVPSEILDAYLESFQGIEDGKVDVALRRSIQQGLWSPTSATEYMQRFIAFASGAESLRYQ